MQSQVLAFLFDNPEGTGPVELVNHLSKFFGTKQIDDHLQTIIEDQQSRGNLYRESNGFSLQLSARCRKQLEEELPKAQAIQSAINNEPMEN